MFKKIVVMLSLKVDGFLGGTRKAETAFNRFAGRIKNAGGSIKGALQSIDAVMGIVAKGLRTLGDMAGFVKEQFIDSAVAIARQERVFTHLTGSVEQSADMIAFLEATSLKYGVALDGLSMSAQQVALSQKAMNGEVDPAIWEELTVAIVALGAARPDVAMDLWGRAISGVLAGDLTTLTRALDVNLTQIEGLSDEAMNFINQGQAAQSAGLGAVTRLGESIAADPGDALAFLRELFELLGINEGLIMAGVTEADLLREAWAAVSRELGDELMPLYSQLGGIALEFIQDNREGISDLIDDIGGLVDKFAEFLDEGGLTGFANTMRDVGDVFRGIAGFLGDGIEAAKQLVFLLAFGADQFRVKLGEALRLLIDNPLMRAFLKFNFKIGGSEIDDFLDSELFAPAKTADELQQSIEAPRRSY